MSKRRKNGPQHGTQKRNEVKRAAKKAATNAPGKLDAHPYSRATVSKQSG